MKRFRFISSILFVLLVFSVPSKGQSDTASMLVLSENEFLNLVRLYHPVVKQADFSVQRAAAALTGARAGFDPLLTTSFEKKKFGGDVYYSYYQPELKIPTWYGIELYAGLEEISGTRVTSEATLGQTSYLGVSVPLLKDLVVDKRRAILKQAKIYQQQNLATRNLIINDLLYEGIGAYWNWVKEYQVYKILDKTIALSEARLRFTSIEYQQGNRPAIDTVEALAQLQQFLLLRNEAFMKFQNAGTEL
ncbi:MAG: TolC family protein [Chitinophagaceae bacterium]|nr:TolC family protein [Chitinophagaceae bacterium]